MCMSNTVDLYNFKRFSSINDKMVIQPTIFHIYCNSRIRCLSRCAVSQGCVSAFYSNGSICEGHSDVYGGNSHFLVFKPGIVYHVSKDQAGLSCFVSTLFKYTECVVLN